MFDLPCILFAGGKSSRMGQDKSLLPFGNYPTLAQYQYERLSKLFSSVYISSKSRDKFDFNPQVIEDPINSDFAPTAGFIAAFEHLKNERIFVLSVDTPFVDETVIQILLEADTPHYDAVVAKTLTGTHPMAGIYHQSLLGELKRMLNEGDHRLIKLLASAKTHYVQFPSEAPFSNLNHPNEYEEAISRYNNTNKSK
ncbi:MAG: molybdenum cofactor guanylyltransferase MobA [Sulfuricurvum sp.]|jgi:molybdopterin-guanine dinucleotide biosynthesis protein A|nr:molybdenum cofactor guanylyltransferase MobA [Sulfuricurvum sp.]MDP3023887.1 molybdenum cofactor guanylyltransferase MobA [Sulfuricurvum sp.]MDP3119238.1 molybdenum cofactor guanylyltransferase MobA [Sulfuricurvum sp.]